MNEKDMIIVANFLDKIINLAINIQDKNNIKKLNDFIYFIKNDNETLIKLNKIKENVTFFCKDFHY